MARARIEPGFDYVLARVAIDFRSELHYPGTVEVGGRFLRVGNRSILSGYGAFLDPWHVQVEETGGEGHGSECFHHFLRR